MRHGLIQEFRALLRNALAQVSEGAETVFSAVETQRKIPESAELMEMAAFQQERDLWMRIHSRNRELLWEIHAAIERIDNGEFGICQECGDDIAPERLRAQPVTRLCIDCKKRLENGPHILERDAGDVPWDGEGAGSW